MLLIKFIREKENVLISLWKHNPKPAASISFSIAWKLIESKTKHLVTWLKVWELFPIRFLVFYEEHTLLAWQTNCLYILDHFFLILILFISIQNFLILFCILPLYCSLKHPSFILFQSTSFHCKTWTAPVQKTIECSRSKWLPHCSAVNTNISIGGSWLNRTWVYSKSDHQSTIFVTPRKVLTSVCLFTPLSSPLPLCSLASISVSISAPFGVSLFQQLLIKVC